IIVMITAITPSLNASSRPFVIFSPFLCIYVFRTILRRLFCRNLLIPLPTRGLDRPIHIRRRCNSSLVSVHSERRTQMRRLLVRAFVVGAVLCAAAVPLFAQQGTSEIGGKVTDEQGAILPGVSIVVTNEESGLFREVTTGADGSYFASQLTPGRYRIAAKLPSFRTFERGGLVLAVGQRLTINVTLALGALEETVKVTAESPLVDTTSVKVGGNIGTIELS